MSELRALSLHQPWASLCVPLAPGEKPVKTIETRGKPLKYRGRLLIHAAKRMPDHPDRVGAFDITLTATGPWAWSRKRGYTVLPLGAIVGSCELVDVVPIGMVGGPHIGDFPHEGELPHQQGGLWLIGQSALNKGTPTRVEDQRPYGDFTPGRYAYLLEDAKRCDERCPACWGKGGGYEVEISPGDVAMHGGCPTCHGEGSCPPIPAKGKQGLWRWEPGLECIPAVAS